MKRNKLKIRLRDRLFEFCEYMDTMNIPQEDWEEMGNTFEWLIRELAIEWHNLRANLWNTLWRIK